MCTFVCGCGTVVWMWFDWVLVTLLVLDYTPEGSVEACQIQAVVSSLHVLEVIAPVLAAPEVPHSLMPLLLPALHSPFTCIRHMASRGVASLYDMDLHFTLEVCLSLDTKQILDSISFSLS